MKKPVFFNSSKPTEEKSIKEIQKTHQLSANCIQNCLELSMTLTGQSENKPIETSNISFSYFPILERKIINELIKIDKSECSINKNIIKIMENDSNNKPKDSSEFEFKFPLDINSQLEKNSSSLNNICFLDLELEKILKERNDVNFLRRIQYNSEIKLSFNGRIHSSKIYSKNALIIIETNELIKSINKRINDYLTYQLNRNEDLIKKQYFLTKINGYENIAVLFEIDKKVLTYPNQQQDYSSFIKLLNIFIEFRINQPHSILIKSQENYFKASTESNTKLEEFEDVEYFTKKKESNVKKNHGFDFVERTVSDSSLYIKDREILSKANDFNNSKYDKHLAKNLIPFTYGVTSFTDLSPFKIDQNKPYFYIKPTSENGSKEKKRLDQKNYKSAYNKEQVSIYEIVEKKQNDEKSSSFKRNKIENAPKINENVRKIFNDNIEKEKISIKNEFIKQYQNTSNFLLLENNIRPIFHYDPENSKISLNDFFEGFKRISIFGINSNLLYQNDMIRINHSMSLSSFEIHITDEELKREILDEICLMKDQKNGNFREFSENKNENILIEYSVCNTCRITYDTSGELTIDYYEPKPIHFRNNLAEQIEILLSSLKSMKNITLFDKISLNSWVSFLLTPVKSNKSQFMTTSFLAYFKFNLEMLSNGLMGLELIGIIPHKLDVEMWINRNEIEVKSKIDSYIVNVFDFISNNSKQTSYDYDYFFK